ncbi:hypothetical protein SCUCBS95973_006559 [Sporothrix curviconia]|uniref:Uncharacterized protein n=1 Tax=Sporothrix curviconia TaxID=1260050 RepID=A0ABP0C656_9PEZI
MAASENIVDRILAVAAERDVFVQKIVATQQASDTLKTLNREITDVTLRLGDAGAKLAKLEDALTEQLVAYKRLSKKGGGMRRLFRSSKDDQAIQLQLMADEIAIGEVGVERGKAEQAKQQLEARLAGAKKERDGLKSAHDDYIQAMNGVEALYGKIFDGPTPDLPEEDALEARVKDAEKKRDALTNRVGNISKTINNLYMAKMRIRFGMDACKTGLQESEKELKAGNGIVASPIKGVVDGAVQVANAEFAKYHQMWWVYKSVGEAKDLVASCNESGDEVSGAVPFNQPFVAGGDAVAVDYDTHKELSSSYKTLPHIKHDEIVQTKAALEQVQAHLDGEIERAEERRRKMTESGGDGAADGLDNERAALDAAVDAARKRLTDYRSHICSVAIAKSKEGTKLDGPGLAAAAGAPAAEVAAAGEKAPSAP